MLSLRARLLLGLTALVAAGLLAAGLVTYTAQRSFLLGRTDQQVLAAAIPISQQLGRGADDGGPMAPPPGEPDGGPAGPAPQAFQPNGTFGERLGADGQPSGRPIVFTYGERTAAAPALPTRFPISASLARARLFTVDSAAGPSLRYRVLALRSPDGGATIVAVPLSAVDQTLARLRREEAMVAAAVLAALVALAWIVIRLGLRPLARMELIAGEIAGGDLSRRVSPEDPRTEVGRLGLALNEMLARIEQAFAEEQASEERMRRFLSDASHELRTPLASIRGYAELFRLGATEHPEDLARAMSRIEAEAARMGILVEDLLLLARLDELPEARAERVELRELAEHAAADARAAAPDRAIELTAPAPAFVRGDPHQLQQVLANLLRNALTHTPPGAPVEIRLQARDGRATLEVADHGPGLPAGAAEHIFERFWRSDPARSRERGGAGLGLAIVSAIIHAHHGEVHAENAPDGGAVFRVILPLAKT
jgi:two-component system, OmpR family, sensor kinase